MSGTYKYYPTIAARCRRAAEWNKTNLDMPLWLGDLIFDHGGSHGYA